MNGVTLLLPLYTFMEYTGTILHLATNCGIYRWARPNNPDTFNLHTLTQISVYLQYHGRRNSSRSDAHTRCQQRRSVPKDQNIHCDQHDKQEAVNQPACCESRPCACPKSELTGTLHMTSQLWKRLGRIDKSRDTCTYTWRFSAQYELIVYVL